MFSPEELQQLTDSFAAVGGTAQLMGMARVLRRVEAVKAKRFNEHALFVFASSGAPISPLYPEAAVQYFKGLVPTLGVDPEHFGADQRRRAFTLARATEESLLGRVKKAILGYLKGAEPSILQGADAVDEILKAAGVARDNDPYSQLVFRTNVMDAYTVGMDEQRRDPDVIAEFPAWRWDGIDDYRIRPAHAERNQRYWPAAIPFNVVRGNEAAERIACRCVPTPIDRFTWEKLTKAGARLEVGRAA
jgi:hypothetical protein